jgi:hypothetical protein
MPYHQRGPQLTACGSQEETKGGVKLAFAIKLALEKDPGVPFQDIQHDGVAMRPFRHNAEQTLFGETRDAHKPILQLFRHIAEDARHYAASSDRMASAGERNPS